jgi:histidinol-phosphatase (PHP family)
VEGKGMNMLQKSENVDNEFLEKPAYVDMHTHSENSHDSQCKIEAMCLAQINRGSKFMAVTDHADIYSYDDYDIYTPIRRGYETVEALNEKYKGQIQLLSGLEISEGFWFPQEYEKMRTLAPYDVVLGSVHCVRYKDLRAAYAATDFSKLTEAEVYEYLEAYFSDIIDMMNATDIDVLTHLTCPLRYITGKYGFAIDLGRFADKIHTILQYIIEHEIALEVNTSSYKVLNDFMPGRDIIQKYYDMGGRIITLGSDAHVAENAAIYFEEATAFLKEIGIENVYYYIKRQKYPFPLY